MNLRPRRTHFEGFNGFATPKIVDTLEISDDDISVHDDDTANNLNNNELVGLSIKFLL